MTHSTAAATDIIGWQDLTSKTFSEYKKAAGSQDLIRNAIMDNDFLKNLETSQIKVQAVN